MQSKIMIKGKLLFSSSISSKTEAGDDRTYRETLHDDAIVLPLLRQIHRSKVIGRRAPSAFSTNLKGRYERRMVCGFYSLL